MQMHPKIGLINVADPRLGPKLKTIQADGERYAAALTQAGIATVCAAQVATDVTHAREMLNAIEDTALAKDRLGTGLKNPAAYLHKCFLNAIHGRTPAAALKGIAS